MTSHRARHKLVRDVDYAVLRDQLSTRLGRPVEVAATPPTPDGEPGEVLVECAVSGEILTLDTAVVRSVVAVCPSRPEYRNSEQVLADDMDAADTVDDQLRAIRAYLQREIDRVAAPLIQEGGALGGFIVESVGDGLVDLRAQLGRVQRTDLHT